MLSDPGAAVRADWPIVSFGVYAASAGPASASVAAPTPPASAVRRRSLIAFLSPWCEPGKLPAAPRPRQKRSRLAAGRDQLAEDPPDAAVVAVELHLVERVRIARPCLYDDAGEQERVVLLGQVR